MTLPFRVRVLALNGLSNKLLMSIVDGNYRVEIYIHLLDTRNSCEKCNFRSLVRSPAPESQATGSIPARDLKLHFSQLFLVRSNKCPLNNSIYITIRSNIIHSGEMPTKS